jgi:hypothetical protein
VFELRNQSPYLARLLPTVATDGAEMVLAVVKGTFELGGREELPLAAAQAPVTLADEFHGEAGESSIRYASDLVPEKRGTDVVLIGSAHVPRGEATAIEVVLEAGPLRARVVVVGDRQWQRSLGRGIHPSPPRQFRSVPLVYERAFGGKDQTSPARSDWQFERRNPVGCGLIANPARRDLAAVALPNLEDPAALINDATQRPRPVGLGFIAPSWAPRLDRAGTYDEAWRRDRFPLPPADFDPRFYNSAHPDLVSKQFFMGGEPVQVTNVSPDGPLRFRVPEVEVTVVFYIDGASVEKRCDLDTVVIEPDQRRLMLTWRAHAPCHRKIKYVTGARVTYRPGRAAP